MFQFNAYTNALRKDLAMKMSGAMRDSHNESELGLKIGRLILSPDFQFAGAQDIANVYLQSSFLNLYSPRLISTRMLTSCSSLQAFPKELFSIIHDLLSELVRKDHDQAQAANVEKILTFKQKQSYDKHVSVLILAKEPQSIMKGESESASRR